MPTDDTADPPGSDVAGAVTVVISRRVRSGRGPDYEAWVRDVIPVAERFAGFEGLSVLRPSRATPDEYALVMRFASYDDLRAWEHSDERRELLRRLRDLTVDEGAWQEQTGLETWFTLPGRPVPAGPPPRWKQAVLSTLALVPLLLVSNALIEDRLDVLGAVLRTVVVTPVLVAIMTWLLMPAVTRLAYRWLYPLE
jgi:antibiotic biosynthesis monooxygenase (ABM) superfamily enzyme